MLAYKSKHVARRAPIPAVLAWLLVIPEFQDRLIVPSAAEGEVCVCPLVLVRILVVGRRLPVATLETLKVPDLVVL